MGDSGFGQQDPSDSVGETNPLLFYIAQRLAKISTIEVVVVKAVDTAAKTVDVQPMVNQLDGNNQSTPHGVILGIIYWQWQFGDNRIEADPVVGDIGIMACSDRDISSVKATKAVSNPGSDRQLDKADGIYFGGALNGDPQQWVKFTADGMEWHDRNGNNILSGSAGININGVLFNRSGQVEGNLPVTGALQLGGIIESVSGDPYSESITTSGDITSTGGEVRASGIPLSTHRHTQSGGGDTGEPII